MQIVAQLYEKRKNFSNYDIAKRLKAKVMTYISCENVHYRI